MSDLISRDKAVAAVLGTSIEYQLIYGKKEPKEGFVRDLIKTLARIPQAEPEIIQCQDCALFDPNWRCGFWHRFTIPEGFCHNYKEREEEEENDRIER